MKDKFSFSMYLPIKELPSISKSRRKYEYPSPMFIAILVLANVIAVVFIGGFPEAAGYVVVEFSFVDYIILTVDCTLAMLVIPFKLTDVKIS
jgi:hypothetical protein